MRLNGLGPASTLPPEHDKMNLATFVRRASALALALLCAFLDNPAAADGMLWPEARLLPAFSTPASMLDCIDLRYASAEEADLFVSLEGIVNRAQPRIAVVTRRVGEGKLAWLDLHHLHYRTTDGYAAVRKYRSEVSGLVVTDPAQPDTLNLATTMAGVNNELICAPELLPILTNAPYRLPVVDDLRNRFDSKYAVYGYLLSNYWPRCTHRIVAGMGPGAHGSLRDFLIATKTATFWLGPGRHKDAALLRSFVSEMKPAHSLYMGWWPGEGDGLKWIASYGVPVLASDFFCNATVFGGVTVPIKVQPIPPLPRLENKVYVALILSDGDNIQYMQHAMKRDWGLPGRGRIPIGWTSSPLAVDLDPVMLNYYYATATKNDCLVSGPSGAGYAHINDWAPSNQVAFAEMSEPYLRQSGLRVITVWDRVNDSVASAFAQKCPSLLGLTDQGQDYSKVVDGLRTIKLTPAYTSSVREMIAHIKSAATNWNGSAPLFIAAQSDIWRVGPRDLLKVAEALPASEYKLVRPDHLFLLANQAARCKP
jgi:hypothetical protein